MSEVIEAAQEAAEEQDFESAFAEFAGDQDRETADDLAEGEELSAESEATSEIDASEPLEQKAGESDTDFASRLSTAEQAAKDWEHRFKSEVGRQTALQRKVQELEAQLKAQPQSKQAQAQRQYSQRMESLMGDFPEIADALHNELEEQLSAIRNEVQQAVAPVRQLEEQRRFEAEESLVKAKYPEYGSVVNSPEFMDWFQSQPAPVQALAASPSAVDAIAVMDYFSATRRPVAANPVVQNIQAKRQQSLERNVSIKNSAPAPMGDGPDDFEKAFAYYANRGQRK